jgi:hypothetical protein
MRLLSCLSALLVAAALVSPAMADKPPKEPGHSDTSGHSEHASGISDEHPGTSGSSSEPGKPSSPGKPGNSPGQPSVPGKPGSSSEPGKPSSPGKPGSSSHHKKPSSPGNSAAHPPSTRKHPGPGTTAAVKAKAYGRWCQNQGNNYVTGRRGTQFRLCLTAMAELATGVTNSPWTACRLLSRKRIHDRTISPYGRCVAAGARFLYELHTH